MNKKNYDEVLNLIDVNDANVLSGDAYCIPNKSLLSAVALYLEVALLAVTILAVALLAVALLLFFFFF